MQKSQKISNTIFYGILDTGYVCDTQLESKCKALIAGGCGIIQLRAKKQTHLERAKMAEKLLPLFEKEDAPIFVVDDDLELAVDLPIGVHIGQEDFNPISAREKLGEEKVLGLSTHSLEQARTADELGSDILDYFAVGPIFATQTKPNRMPVGLNLISEVKKFAPKLPWFCIGGINLNTIYDVAKAGAERIVAVSDVLKPNDTALAVQTLTREFLLRRKV